MPILFIIGLIILVILFGPMFIVMLVGFALLSAMLGLGGK